MCFLNEGIFEVKCHQSLSNHYSTFVLLLSVTSAVMLCKVLGFVCFLTFMTLGEESHASFKGRAASRVCGSGHANAPPLCLATCKPSCQQQWGTAATAHSLAYLHGDGLGHGHHQAALS